MIVRMLEGRYTGQILGPMHVRTCVSTPYVWEAQRLFDSRARLRRAPQSDKMRDVNHPNCMPAQLTQCSGGGA